MKKRDFILISGIILIAFVIWLASSFFYSGESNYLRITVDNEVYGEYELTEDQEIAINDTNICAILHGNASMIFGDCPDKVCVHSLAISKSGQTIICMPNKVVLEIVGSDASQIDTFVQ